MAEGKGKFLGVKWSYRTPLWLDIAASILAGLGWMAFAFVLVIVGGLGEWRDVGRLSKLPSVAADYPWVLNTVSTVNGLIPFALAVGAICCFRNYSRMYGSVAFMYMGACFMGMAGSFKIAWLDRAVFWVALPLSALFAMVSFGLILASVFDVSRAICLKLGWYKHYTPRGAPVHSDVTFT